MRRAALLVASCLCALAVGAAQEASAARKVAAEARSGAAAKAVRARAVKLLQGDPYGRTPAEVDRHIRALRRAKRAPSPCDGERGPVWVVEVFVPSADNAATGKDIEGVLVLDGKGKRRLCANLPFLD